MTCQRVRLTVPPGADPSDVFWDHNRAALGEGCCPMCGCRLTPVDTRLGVGGACWHCDHAWATDGQETCRWRMTDPFTHRPLSLFD